MLKILFPAAICAVFAFAPALQVQASERNIEELKQAQALLEAIVENIKAAENGDARSQFILAVMVNDVINAADDASAEMSTEFTTWLRKSADGGFAVAQVLLATLHFSGTGVERDAQKAERWLKAAADNSFAPAQYLYGQYLIHEIPGFAFRQNFIEGNARLKISNENGCPAKGFSFPDAPALSDKQVVEVDAAAAVLRKQLAGVKVDRAYQMYEVDCEALLSGQFPSFLETMGLSPELSEWWRRLMQSEMQPER